MFVQDSQNTDKNFWMARAFEEAQRSTCTRNECNVGAIAVWNGELLAFGYNGTSGAITSCTDRGYCVRRKKNIESGTRREVAYCTCAEQHMICNAARDGTRLNGAEVYITHKPCAICVRLMLKCGIVRAYYKNDYPEHFTDELCRETGFELIKL